MAFTLKLTDQLKEAIDTARADNASMYTFILKNEGHDAQSFAVNLNEQVLFCVMATIVTGLEEYGFRRKDIFKILDKTMREAGPLEREDIED